MTKQVVPDFLRDHQASSAVKPIGRYSLHRIAVCGYTYKMAFHFFSWIKLGIRHKIVLMLIMVVGLSLGMMGWLTLRQQEEEVRTETLQRGKALTHFVSQSLVYTVVAHDYHTLQMMLGEIVQSPQITYVKVLSSKNNIMAEAGVWHPTAATGILFTEPILLEEKPVGELVIGFDNRLLTAQLKGQKNRFIAYEVIVILIIALGEFAALSYLIVRPVRVISEALDRDIAEGGQMDHLVPVISNDEIGGLAMQLNVMRGQLKMAHDQLRSRIDAADAELHKTNETLKVMNEELKRLSITDTLTGLYNRRQFEWTFENEMAMTRRYREPLSLLLIDIDHFKSINDTYGHVVGDRVLAHVADNLRKNLRETNVVARIGGEEFAMLCKRTDQEQSIPEKIRQSIENSPYDNAGTAIRVTISLGAATFYAETLPESVSECLHVSDEALYQSKRSGRNRVTHSAKTP